MEERIVQRNPRIQGGVQVFTGTRVPVKTCSTIWRPGKRLNNSCSIFQPWIALLRWRWHGRRWTPVRILLDESLPRRLIGELSEHAV